MEVKNPPGRGESDIAELAGRQHGYVTRKQLLDLGVGRRAIESRMSRGLLIRVHAGVYAVGHLPTLPVDRAYAALLACGRGAAISHATAAAAWGIDSVWRAPFEVTAARRIRRTGICTHVAELARDDIRTHLGLRVTGPARTVLDLAPRLTEAELEAVVDDLRHSYLKLEQLGKVVERYPGHRGAAAIRRIIERPSGPTRSQFEREFKAFVKRYGLPMPLINPRVHGYEADALFAAERVIVELDGWDFHSSRRSFRSDRARDAHLLAHGYATVRITWERLTEQPDELAAQLGTILARQRRVLTRAA